MHAVIHLHISKHAKVKKQSTKNTKETQIFYLKEIYFLKKFIDKLTKFCYYSIFNIKCGFILLEFNGCIQSILIIFTPYSFHAILLIPPNIVLYQSQVFLLLFPLVFITEFNQCFHYTHRHEPSTGTIAACQQSYLNRNPIHLLPRGINSQWFVSYWWDLMTMLQFLLKV